MLILNAVRSVEESKSRFVLNVETTESCDEYNISLISLY